MPSLGTATIHRLQAVAREELSTVSPTHMDLVPPTLRHRGDGTVGRYLALKAADRLRTDVLGFMASFLAIDRLQAEFRRDELERLEMEMTEYGTCVRLEGARAAFAAWEEGQLLAALRGRHPDGKVAIRRLVNEIDGREIDAFRQACRMYDTDILDVA